MNLIHRVLDQGEAMKRRARVTGRESENGMN